MRMVVQRVKKAAVLINENTIGSISNGALVLLGVGREDREKDVLYLVDRFINLRFFADDNGKMNLSLIDKKFSVLVVSQFTLYADCKSGRRPSFTKAASPEKAKALYEYFIQELKNKGIHTETGEFGAHMQIELVNDGPVTFIMDSI